MCLTSVRNYKEMVWLMLSKPRGQHWEAKTERERGVEHEDL